MGNTQALSIIHNKPEKCSELKNKWQVFETKLNIY